MIIEPKGDWEHSAYQSDNQFVVEVRPIKVDPSKLTQGAGYGGEKLSLNFQNIEVRSLLQVIADFTNFNIVTSDSVTGAVTLRLKDVPWDQALDIVLQAKGLGMRKTGNVMWIAPKDEITSKEKLELEAPRRHPEPGAGAHAVLPVELHQGGRDRAADGTGAVDGGHGQQHADPEHAWQRDCRATYQPGFCHGHSLASGTGTATDREARYRCAAGVDRGAHRRSFRYFRQIAGRPAGRRHCQRHARSQ